MLDASSTRIVDARSLVEKQCRSVPSRDGTFVERSATELAIGYAMTAADGLRAAGIRALAAGLGA
jgi:hypothetical protein